MYFHEITYDLDILTRHNMHMHTSFSGCGKVDAIVCDIIPAAEAAGLEMIALTDHHNVDVAEEQCIVRNRYLREQVAKTGTKIKVLFGNELSAYAPGETLETEKIRSVLDYKLYSCNHYHLKFWGHPEDKSARGYALYSLENVRSLIMSGKADCIAHPFIGRFVKVLEPDKTRLTKAITDNELGDILTLGKEHEMAWEINSGAILGDPEFGKRLWNTGKEVGVCFNFGTDTHNLAGIDTKQYLDRLKEILY